MINFNFDEFKIFQDDAQCVKNPVDVGKKTKDQLLEYFNTNKKDFKVVVANVDYLKNQLGEVLADEQAVIIFTNEEFVHGDLIRIQARYDATIYEIKQAVDYGRCNILQYKAIKYRAYTNTSETSIRVN